jgi:hypothetical protein
MMAESYLAMTQEERADTLVILLSGKLDLNRVNGFLPTCF